MKRKADRSIRWEAGFRVAMKDLDINVLIERAR
jgi:hypothetical protein